MKKKVLVCVLCGNERHTWSNPYLFTTLLTMVQDSRFDVTVEMIGDGFHWIDRARNVCVTKARQQRADWLIQFDNDIVPPSNLLDILAGADQSGKEIVVLGYAVLFDSGIPVVLPTDNGRRDGEFRVAGCIGGGVLMVKARVWETIPGPWFRWVSNDDETTTLKVGEDYYFCELVQHHGFTVWTHRALAGHLRAMNITRVAIERECAGAPENRSNAVKALIGG